MTEVAGDEIDLALNAARHVVLDVMGELGEFAVRLGRGERADELMALRGAKQDLGPYIAPEGLVIRVVPHHSKSREVPLDMEIDPEKDGEWVEAPSSSTFYKEHVTWDDLVPIFDGHSMQFDEDSGDIFVYDVARIVRVRLGDSRCWREQIPE